MWKTKLKNPYFFTNLTEMFICKCIRCGGNSFKYPIKLKLYTNLFFYELHFIQEVLCITLKIQYEKNKKLL